MKLTSIYKDNENTDLFKDNIIMKFLKPTRTQE